MLRQILNPESKTIYKFKLLLGHHSWNEGTDQNPKLVTVHQGEEFETDIAYHKLSYNSPGSQKFLLVDAVEEDTEESLEAAERAIAERKAKLRAKKAAEGGVAEAAKTGFQVDPELRKKKMVELQQIAESNGIDISKCNSKEDLIKAIEEATVPA